MAEWPASLPSPRRTAAVRPGKRMSETAMLSGRRVVRNWGALPPDTLTVQLTVRETEEATLRYFWNRVGMNGIWFTADWLTIVGYDNHKARFLGYPKRKGIAASVSSYLITFLVQQSDLCNDPPQWVDDVVRNWLEGWSYRKKFDVISTGGATTGYTISLTLKQWLAWNNHPSNPVLSGGQAWEGVNVYSMCVVTNCYGTPVLESGYMRGFWGGYDGTNGRIGTGTSLTGVSWSKFASNPIFGVGIGSTSQSWNALNSNAPCVIYDDSADIYKMWFSGNSVGGQDQIGYATAAHPEGVWTPHVANPILTLGYASNEYYVSEPTVIKKSDGTYHMWYTGSNASLTVRGIYYATSSNGISWSRQGKVLDNVDTPDVKLYNDDVLIMAVRLYSPAYSIIYRSVDGGYTWGAIDYYAVPFVDGISGYGTITPCMVKYSSFVWLFFYCGVSQAAGNNNNICMAYSGDNGEQVGLDFKSNDLSYDNIRFTEPDGETLIPYYRESVNYVDGKCAMRIKLSTVKASATQYYLYYDNPDADEYSSMADTFLFGDDFGRANSSEVGNGWIESTSYISATNLVVLRSGTDESCYRSFETTYSIELECKMSSSVTNSSTYVSLFTVNKMMGLLLGNDGYIRYMSSTGWILIGPKYNANAMVTVGLIYLIGLDKITYLLEREVVASGIDPYPAGGEIVAVNAVESDHSAKAEYIWIRKYFSVEPEIETWYAEESY